jgi:peptidoglycan/LPS O-acetylase OafA/YrhL
VNVRDYRPDIDGLRAIAVLSVVLFHFGWGQFSGGFIGVDVFFVISGYLITRLITGEVASTGAFHFRRFYVRRMRRLFPALAVVLLLSAIAAAFIFSPEHLKRFSRELMTAALSVSNIFFFTVSGYFDVAKKFQALLHTWSLGVEEQFYLVWPVLIVWAMRSGRRILPAALMAAAIASLYYAHTLDDRSAAFFLTPFRIFEFAIGASLVWLIKVQPANKLLLEPILLCGLGMIGYAVFAYSSETHLPGLLTLPPTVGAALAIYAGRARYTGLLLRNPLSVWVGKISYSLYLVHWPLVIFPAYITGEPFTAIERVGLLAVSIALAALIHYGVEQPLRRPRAQADGGNVRFMKGLAATTLLLLVFGASVVLGQGWAWRLSPDAAKLLASTTREIEMQGECQYEIRGSNEAFQQKFNDCAAKAGKAVLIVGDSHASDLFNALAHNGARRHVVGVADGGCRPIGPEACRYDEFGAFIAANRDKLAGVLFVQMGGYFLTDLRHLPVDTDGIDETIDYLTRFAQPGIPLLWVGPQWEPYYEVDQFVATMPAVERPDYLRNSAVHIADVDAAIEAVVTRRESPVDYVSRTAILGPLTADQFVIDGEYTYSDTDHWSAKGEEVFGRRLLAGSAKLRELFGMREDRKAGPDT